MRMNGWQYKRISLFLALLLMVFAVPSVSAQSQNHPQDFNDDNLAQTLQYYVDQLKDDPNSEGEIVGYDVYSLDRDKTIASSREDITFVPASVMKLLVTSTAVSLLPEDLHIPTEAYLKGNLTDSGELQGDVVLKGYGDPVLTVKKLDQLAEALADHGVQSVQGNIVVDDHYFSGNRLGKGWMWDDEPYYYSPQIDALSVNDNTVDVKMKPTTTGEKPDVSVTPAPDYVKVVNQAKTVEGRGMNLSVDRKRGTNEMVVSGTIGEDYGSSYEDTFTIDKPSLFTGTVFRDQLKKHDISFAADSKIKKGKADSEAEPVANVNSPNLDNMLRTMDKESSNFIAEMMTKQMGAKKGDEGTTAAGIKVIGDFVHNELGVDNNFVQKDGSGLTRLDHISSHDYIQLLKAMDHSPARDRFLSFLPVAGVDGTLAGRMKGTPAEDNVTAKTGSMSGVNSLVGYVTGKNGERFAFSILINGIYKVAYSTKLQDDIAVTLAKYPDLPDAQPVTGKKDHGLLADQLDPIIEAEDYQGVMKGAVVYSVDRDKLLYARNPKSLMTPKASTKLLTSATALDKLGPDYRFKTEVYQNGTLSNGVLDGDVIVKGYGDPTLTTKDSEGLQGPNLKEMAKDLEAQGIHSIDGDIIVDDSAFSDDVYPVGWRWDKESDPDQAQITALAVNQGTVQVNVKPKKQADEHVEVTLIPKTSDIEVINKATTGGSGSKNTLQIDRERGKNTIRVTGNLPVGADEVHQKIAIEQPQVNAGHVLRKQLEKQGVSFNTDSHVKIGKTADEAGLVKTYHSPKLAKIVRYQNHHNDSFTAEMILKTLGMEVNGKDQSTFDDGIDVVHDYMDSLDIDSRFDMMDGSGQTRYNQMSAELFVSLLKAQRKQSTFDAFYDSQAVAGEKGILRNHMDETAAAHRLRGITGNSSDLRGMSGYVKTKDGELLAYSILMGGASDKSLGKLIDQFGTFLAKVQLDHIADLKTMVYQFDDSGAFTNDQAVHRLLIHLDAVIHYEQTGSTQKVIKHLKGFKVLLKHEKNNEMISDPAYETLKTVTDSFIERLSK